MTDHSRKTRCIRFEVAYIVRVPDDRIPADKDAIHIDANINKNNDIIFGYRERCTDASGERHWIFKQIADKTNIIDMVDLHSEFFSDWEGEIYDDYTVNRLSEQEIEIVD